MSGGERPSWRVLVLLPLLGGAFALVGNLATSTVEVAGPWMVSAWVATFLLLAGMVYATVRPPGEGGTPPRRPSPVRGWIVVAGAATLGLGFGLLLPFISSKSSAWDDKGIAPTHAVSTAEGAISPSEVAESPSATTTVTPTVRVGPGPSPTRSPAVAPEPVVVQERWRGTLEFTADQMITGWWLDNNPPGRAITGDVHLTTDGDLVGGQAIVRWDGVNPPGYEECADLLNTHRGNHVVDVRPGVFVCIGTIGNRVAWLQAVRIPRAGRLSAQAGVWERQ